MMKKILQVLFIGFILASVFPTRPVFADEKTLEAALTKEGLTQEDFREATHYYKNLQPDKMVKVIKVMLEEFAGDPIHFKPFAHLVATIAQNNPEFLEALKDINPATSDGKNALEEIFMQSKNYQSPAPESPYHLDLLWAEFLATGSDEPVRKIISTQDYQEQTDKAKLTEEDLNKVLTFSTARWSLTSNAQQHEKVKNTINQVLAETKDETIKKNLTEILQDAETKE